MSSKVIIFPHNFFFLICEFKLLSQKFLHIFEIAGLTFPRSVVRNSQFWSDVT